MQLKTDFITKMQALLGHEADAFFATYTEKKASGLRINPLKLSNASFLSISPFTLEDVPFCPTGFYYSENDQPGKHPFHQAGLYYMQEPSAMFVAEVLSPNPGDKVLDLCAAPGGKSTQLAGMMANKGLLVSNEIHPKRVKALSENIERLGVSNSMITNERPEHLVKHFQGYFDKILVDAPCSGEGMFRKDPEASSYWSLDHVAHCASLQHTILDNAYEMLNEGGILVYSTCTFAPEENEQQIEAFLLRHPDLELLPIKTHDDRIKDGVIEWTKHHTEAIGYTKRLWPHHVRGEGHFVAKLRKTTATSENKVPLFKECLSKEQLKSYKAFEKETLQVPLNGQFSVFKNQLCLLPDDCPAIDGLKVVRLGLHIGEFKKNRFEPHHAFAMGLAKDQVTHVARFATKQEEWKKYVRGETVSAKGENGWTLVTIEGFPLGWGKMVNGVIKNHFPKGLRLPI